VRWGRLKGRDCGVELGWVACRISQRAWMVEGIVMVSINILQTPSSPTLGAGCRVAICVKTNETLQGCLVWDKAIHKDSFVYCCPYYGWTLKEKGPVCAVQLPNIMSPNVMILLALVY
jgi:hypothetical protein